MLGSCISINPTTDHNKQFKTVAKVNGRGMLLADFVFKTVCKAAKGDPNMATQKRTAIFPIHAAGSAKGDRYTKANVPAITMAFAWTC